MSIPLLEIQAPAWLAALSGSKTLVALVRGPEIGCEGGELALEAAGGIGTSQAADLDDAAVLAGPDADEHSPRRVVNESRSPASAAMPKISAGSCPGSWVTARLAHCW